MKIALIDDERRREKVQQTIHKVWRAFRSWTDSQLNFNFGLILQTERNRNKKRQSINGENKRECWQKGKL